MNLKSSPRELMSKFSLLAMSLFLLCYPKLASITQFFSQSQGRNVIELSPKSTNLGLVWYLWYEKVTLPASN